MSCKPVREMLVIVLYESERSPVFCCVCVVCIYYFRISIEVFVYAITELGPRRRGHAEISRERHTRTTAKSESSRAPGVSFFNLKE